MNVIPSCFGLMVPHGQLIECIARLEEALSAQRKTPYHDILGRTFLHQTAEAADFLIAFHRDATSRSTITALYFEMNGFDINPDLWYFDGFGYQSTGDIWELEWLAHWDEETNDPFVLTGMETVQRAFAKLYCDQDQPLSIKLSAELAEHLVTARYMELIAAAHQVAKQRYEQLQGVPVLATAHDWDIIHQTE